jgi:hypothetical protein
MQIDRSNYEIWIIDWLDGNLNIHQAEQLKLFLDANPDLRVEFDELSNVNIKPKGNPYPNKNQLKKETTDLPVSQFEYLSVGYFENDLSKDQEAELLEIIDKDSRKKSVFELIGKTRLSPVPLSYKHKNLLIKRTYTQKVIRLSVIGLSAAATIAIMFMVYQVIPKSPTDKIASVAQTIQVDSSKNRSREEVIPGNAIAIKETVQNKKQSRKMIAVTNINLNVPANQIPVISPTVDSMVRNSDNQIIQKANVPAVEKIILAAENSIENLVALHTTPVIAVEDDGRSKLNRFIAKTFRETFLKDKVTKDTPIKGYEIAEAGVTGLNKLFGWEMALDEKKNESGELSSVYFSSKILKFNAPVKKSEPLQ